MTTKVYYWDDQGVIKDVTVTFEKSTCEFGIGDVNLSDYEKYTTLTVSVDAAIGVNLVVDIDATEERNGSIDTGTYPFNYQMIISAGSSSASHQRICEKRQNTPQGSGGGTVDQTDTYEYLLADQRVTPNQGQALAVTHQKNDVTCNGADNGSIIINANGGVPPYAYIWPGGAINTGSVRTGLPAGSYSVTVNDSNGGSESINNIVINEPSSISAAISVTDAVCYESATGQVNVMLSGGTGALTAEWNDGSADISRVNIIAGDYLLTVTDENGCKKEFEVAVGQPERLEVEALVNGRDVDLTVSGGVAPYSYAWSDGSVQANRQALVPDAYTVTVMDTNGCSTVVAINIFDDKFFFSKNPVLLQLVATNAANKPNLSFIVEIWVEENYLSNEFVKVYAGEQPANTGGGTSFDVREILDAYHNLEVPAYNESGASRAEGAFFRFYLVHAEKYGEVPVQGATRVVNTYYVLLGGLSDSEWSRGVFFTEYLPLQQPFFNWEPTTKNTLADSHEYLNYLVHNAAWTQLNLIATIHYGDGTEHEEQLLTVDNIATYETYRFAAGYNQLGLAQYAEGRYAVRYMLHLTDQNGSTISELREFILQADKPHYKNLIFQNSLGGWSSLTTFGHAADQARVKGGSFDRQLPDDYVYSDRKRYETDKSAELTSKVYIGYLDNTLRAWLLDFALSDQVFEVTGQGYLPVTIKFDVNLADSYELLDDVSFKILYQPVSQFTPHL